MSAVTPDSSIRLLKCPIKLDDHNQITFNNITAQTNYFLSLPYLYDNNLTYIRKDGVIRVGTNSEVQYEDLLHYNYVMYKNTHYEDKWFYAYVTSIEYKNDGCTEITIETDVYQTWMFDASFQSCFIEREHVNDDTLGKHTIPENIEHGEYVCNGYDYTSEIDQMCYILCATTNTSGATNKKSTNICGIPYMGYIYKCNTISELEQIITSFGAYQENIYAVYMTPRKGWESAVMYGSSSYQIDYVPIEGTSDIFITKPTSVNGYSPKNNKVKCFPYMYLLASNNSGQSNVYKWEQWNQTDAEFELWVLPTIGTDSKITPLGYNFSGHDEENSLTGGKWPTLSWSQDMFTNWLSQNAVNIGIGQASSVLSIVGGVGLLATGGGTAVGVGMIGAGIAGIAGSMAQVYQHEFDPTSARGNTNASGINTTLQRNGFYFYKMSIKQEYAKIIDDFFSMYGYKVNRVGTPHIHVRSKWDYCKTIDCHLSGNIPETDMQKLRDLYNNGCTFWHDTSHFMDYSQTNSII